MVGVGRTRRDLRDLCCDRAASAPNALMRRFSANAAASRAAAARFFGAPVDVRFAEVRGGAGGGGGAGVEVHGGMDGGDGTGVGSTETADAEGAPSTTGHPPNSAAIHFAGGGVGGGASTQM